MARSELTLVLGLGESAWRWPAGWPGRGCRLRVADSRDTPPASSACAPRLRPPRSSPARLPRALLDGVAAVAISGPASTRASRWCRPPARGASRSSARWICSCRPCRPRGATAPAHHRHHRHQRQDHHHHPGRRDGRGVGLDGVVAGNISPAALDVMHGAPDAGHPLPQAWVLELSSFQLETGPAPGARRPPCSTSPTTTSTATPASTTTPPPRRGLHRRGRAGAQPRRRAGQAMACRAQVHLRPRRPPGPDDFGLGAVERRRAARPAEAAKSCCRRSGMQLAGSHNVANALAALALRTTAGLPRAWSRPSKAFRGLPHRVEKVAAGPMASLLRRLQGHQRGRHVAALEGLRHRSC